MRHELIESAQEQRYIKAINNNIQMSAEHCCLRYYIQHSIGFKIMETRYRGILLLLIEIFALVLAMYMHRGSKCE